MAVKDNISSELHGIFKTIKNNIVKRYPNEVISIHYFIYAVLCDSKCKANEMLAKLMFTSALNNIKSVIELRLEEDKHPNVAGDAVYDKSYDALLSELSKTNDNIDSADFLYEVFKTDEFVKKLFMQNGVDNTQLKEAISTLKTEQKKKKNSNKIKLTLDTKIANPKDVGETERELADLTKEIEQLDGMDYVYGRDDFIKDKILPHLSRAISNNVLLVGDHGVGKTSIIRRLASLMSEGNVPRAFANKKLMLLDLFSLSFSGAPRPIFDANFKNIIGDAAKRNKYIFVIDDIECFFTDSRIVDSNIKLLLDNILYHPAIPVLCTMSTAGYTKYVDGMNNMPRTTVVKLDCLSNDEIRDAISKKRVKYELLYDVEYTDEAINYCLDMCERFHKNTSLLSTAIDIIDICGAKRKLNQNVDVKVLSLESELLSIREQRQKSADAHDTDLYDELTAKEVELKSKLDNQNKISMLASEPLIIDKDYMSKIISDYFGNTLVASVSQERENIKNLATNLKKQVIGQEDAIDKVSMSIKRQRVGMSNPDKPAVFMFIGDSGTGKTYLAKMLAKEVFGADKSFVRIDMGEYSDKTSVTKLYGSSPGYVGYDEGGILTNAVKKNEGRCVLLLDEIEKAIDEVHDALLQMFDEGRMTDNKGVTVDFSKVIIIMTSNVGTKESLLRGNGVGFIENNNMHSEIIKKSLKQKFKPEFINRIDNIVLFNRLSDENLHKIVELEIDNLVKRINKIGYNVDNIFIKKAQKIVNSHLKNEIGMGARPILRIIQQYIEDKVTDYIIDNNPPNGYTFSSEIL